jgi:trk system potassium uptake protein
VNVVIMGCGRVGARIATILDNNGHDVAVIEIDPDAFRRLPPGFSGRTVIGTGIDEDVLRAAGIERADAFIAVSGKDNRNIMATQLVQLQFQVEERICRITDPVREETYRRMGMKTVCPTTTLSATIVDQVINSEGAERGRATDPIPG